MESLQIMTLSSLLLSILCKFDKQQQQQWVHNKEQRRQTNWCYSLNDYCRWCVTSCGISDHIPETTIKPIKFLCKFYSNDAFNNSHRDIQDNEETLGYDLKRNE